jgi:sodium-coupled neutral amino acid transporter 9
MDEKLLAEKSIERPRLVAKVTRKDQHGRNASDGEILKNHKRSPTADGKFSKSQNSGSPRSPKSPPAFIRTDSGLEDGVSAQRSPFTRQTMTSNDGRSQYLHSKMSYYRKLEAAQRTASPQQTGGLNISAPPPHVLPASLYGIKSGPGHTQSSVTTVLSIWNTMIGSTLIALPYGFSESGMILGFGVCIFMGSISFYTCTLVIRHGLDLPDFNDYVALFFGKRGSYIGLSFSIMILLGVLMAFHILMTENLYQVVKQLLPDHSVHDPHMSAAAACHDSSGAHSFWTEKTAAVVILIIFPLTNLKEVGKLVAMNAYGIYPLAVAISFVLFKGFKCMARCACVLARFLKSSKRTEPHSCHFRVLYSLFFCSADCMDHSPVKIEMAKPTFGKLAGLTSLAFFVHNAIHPILRNGDPKTRNRDTCMAFVMVGICYVVVGAVGYAGFGPCGTDAVTRQNFLMTFPSNDWFAFCARAAMVMQLATVYPLIAFIIRTQVQH